MGIDILSWYLKHKPDLVTSDLYKSGRRLQFEWQLSNSLINSSYNGHINSSSLDSDKISKSINQANNKVEYFARVSDALNFVGSPSLDDILISVICEEYSMKVFEKNNGWCPGSGNDILRISLARLKQHYDRFDELQELSLAIIRNYII